MNDVLVLNGAQDTVLLQAAFREVTDTGSRAPGSILFSPAPMSPKERSITTSRARKLWAMPLSRRSSQKSPRTGG